MGLFDTVHFKCPKCGTNLSIQSKAGTRGLKDYGNLSVPAEIAIDLNGETLVCTHCSTVVKLSIPAHYSIRLPLEISIGTGDEWD